jgi:hypothetical protein
MYVFRLYRFHLFMISIAAFQFISDTDCCLFHRVPSIFIDTHILASTQISPFHELFINAINTRECNWEYFVVVLPLFFIRFFSGNVKRTGKEKININSSSILSYMVHGWQTSFIICHPIFSLFSTVIYKIYIFDWLMPVSHTQHRIDSTTLVVIWFMCISTLGRRRKIYYYS